MAGDVAAGVGVRGVAGDGRWCCCWSGGHKGGK